MRSGVYKDFSLTLFLKLSVTMIKLLASGNSYRLPLGTARAWGSNWTVLKPIAKKSQANTVCMILIWCFKDHISAIICEGIWGKPWKLKAYFKYSLFLMCFYLFHVLFILKVRITQSQADFLKVRITQSQADFFFFLKGN